LSLSTQVSDRPQGPWRIAGKHSHPRLFKTLHPRLPKASPPHVHTSSAPDVTASPVKVLLLRMYDCSQSAFASGLHLFAVRYFTCSGVTTITCRGVTPEKQGATTLWRLPWAERASYRDPGVTDRLVLCAKTSSICSSNVANSISPLAYSFTQRVSVIHKYCHDICLEASVSVKAAVSSTVLVALEGI
jgi:hypothetical protein